MSIYIKLLITTAIVTISQSLFSLLLPFITYEYTHSYASMALVKTIEYLPNVTIVLLLGNLIDKYGWRSNMIFSMLSQAVIIFLVIAVIFFNLNNNMLVLAGIFLVTTMSVLFNNARVYAIKIAVNNDRLPQANSFVQAILQVSQLIAPILLSLFIMLNNVYYGFIFCSLCLFSGSILIFLTRKIENVQVLQKNINRSSNSIMYFLAKEKSLLKLSMIAAIINGVESSQVILFIFQSKETFQLTNTTVGVLFSSVSLIVILFSILIGKYKNTFFNSHFFVFIFSLSSILYAGCYFYNNMPMLVISLLISNIAFTITAVYVWTYRQANTPLTILGRITSITSMIFKLGIPIMMLCTYLVTSYIHQTANYLLFALLCLLIVVVILFDHVSFQT